MAPVQVYPLQLELEFKTESEAFIITPLDEYGVPDYESSDTIPANSSGWVNYTLDQSVKQSIWYGIESYSTSADTSNTAIDRHRDLFLSTCEYKRCLYRKICCIGMTLKSHKGTKNTGEVENTDINGLGIE